jgi:hypothetical protein
MRTSIDDNLHIVIKYSSKCVIEINSKTQFERIFF